MDCHHVGNLLLLPCAHCPFPSAFSATTRMRARHSRPRSSRAPAWQAGLQAMVFPSLPHQAILLVLAELAAGSARRPA